MSKTIKFTIIMILSAINSLQAMHPLITDDTGTQGLLGIELELSGEYGYDADDNAKIYSAGTGLSASIGIYKVIDLVICLPYQWIKTKETSSSSFEHGLGDMNCEAKWCFFESAQFSFAIKPGLIIPTGDESRELGSGQLGYTSYFITTYINNPVALYFNAGYIRNNNDADNHENLWHVSFAVEYILPADFISVVNIGCEKNPLKNDDIIPAFLLGGLAYSINDMVDIDCGIKWGFTRPKTDITVLAGATVHFQTLDNKN